MQVVSKRVTNAKSESHYRQTGPLGKKRELSFWEVWQKCHQHLTSSSPLTLRYRLLNSNCISILLQNLKKQISTHPVVVLLILIMCLTSGMVANSGQPFYSLASLKLCSHSTSPFTYRHSILLHAREAYPRRHVRHSRHVTLTKSIFPLSLPILLTLRYIYVNTSLSFSFSLSHTRTLIKHTNASIGKRTRIGMKK